MTKSRDEIKKEIYYFIEEQYLETGKSVILQTILDRFCKKYNTSTATITRMLDELVKKRSPFRLVTYYDKNRHYCIKTISLGMQIYLTATVAIPTIMFFICLLGNISFRFFEWIAFAFIGFWLSQIFNHVLEKKSINKKV